MAIDYFSALARRAEQPPARWRRPFLVWLNGIEAGWGIPLLIFTFAVAWLAYLKIAYLGGGLHPDTLEAWVLGRGLEWGYPKHPPLMAWVARGWTSVFPLTDGSFQLLAMTNSALALWAVDLISRRFVRGDKRAVVLLLLMLPPIYQFHAQRFNANTVLLAVWPFATYFFLRSFETRHFGWAAAAGMSAAVAMLGKYYSIFLVASFVFAAVLHPDRRLYFASWAPWVSTAMGLLVLGPHLHWLATTGATPFQYALDAQAGVALPRSLAEALFFLLGIAASLSLGAACWMTIAVYQKKQLRYFSADGGLRLLLLISIGTIVFPMCTAVTLGTYLPSTWAMQGLFLFSVVAVCGTGCSIAPFYSVNLTVFVMGIAAIAAIVAAPLHAVYRNANSYEEAREFYQPVALELTRQWHERSTGPLAAVTGDEALAFATAFYSPDHPAYERAVASANAVAIPDRGFAVVCFDGQQPCIDGMRKLADGVAPFSRFDLVVQSRLLGWPGTTRRVSVLMFPVHRGRPPT